MAGVAMLAAGVAMGYGVYLSASLTLPAGDEHPPRLIYGAPFLLKPDLDITSSHLLERLNQLGYRAVEGHGPHPVIIGRRLLDRYLSA